MDERLASALASVPEPYRGFLRLIALTESGGNPSTVNPSGGSWGAIGAFQMRRPAMMDQGLTPDVLLSDPALQVRAAYTHLMRYVLPAIKVAGRTLDIATIGQAWLDGQGTLSSPPSKDALDWIDRARRYAGTVATQALAAVPGPVATVARGAASVLPEKMKRGAPWALLVLPLGVVVWYFGRGR
jgi:hypothetical protein